MNSYTAASQIARGKKGGIKKRYGTRKKRKKTDDDATQANGHRRHNIGSLPYQYQPVVAMARHPFYIHSVTSHAVHFSHVNIKYHHTRGDLVLISFFLLISALLFILFGFTPVANFSPFAAQPGLSAGRMDLCGPCTNTTRKTCPQSHGRIG